MKRAIAEIIAAAMTGLLHPLFVDVLRAKALFIALAGLGWSVYFVYRVRRDRSVLQDWGFREKNLRPALLAALAVLLAGLLAISLLATGQGTIRFNRHMIPRLLFYPAWGLLQQFLVQALFVRNLQDAGVSILVIVLAAAALFGLIHLPDWKLAIATAALGAALTPIYIRWRNLWPLGFCHGWLGVFGLFLAFSPRPVGRGVRLRLGNGARTLSSRGAKRFR